MSLVTFNYNGKHIFTGVGKAEAKVHFVKDLMENEKK